MMFCKCHSKALAVVMGVLAAVIYNAEGTDWEGCATYSDCWSKSQSALDSAAVCLSTQTLNADSFIEIYCIYFTCAQISNSVEEFLYKSKESLLR